MNLLTILLDTSASTNSTTSSTIGTVVMIVAMIAIFYFLLYRPQKKQEKAQADLRNSIEIGDEVTTIGGIIGEVVSMKGETVVIETTKNGTKIRFLKSAIKTVDVKANEEVPEEPKEAEKEENASKDNVKGKLN